MFNKNSHEFMDRFMVQYHDLKYKLDAPKFRINTNVQHKKRKRSKNEKKTRSNNLHNIIDLTIFAKIKNV